MGVPLQSVLSKREDFKWTDVVYSEQQRVLYLFVPKIANAGPDQSRGRGEDPELKAFMAEQSQKFAHHKNNLQGMRAEMQSHIGGEGSSAIIDEIITDRYRYFANLGEGYQRWDRNDTVTAESVKAAAGGLNGFVGFLTGRYINETTLRPKGEIQNLIIDGAVNNLNVESKNERPMRVQLGYNGSAKNVALHNIPISEINFYPYTSHSGYSLKTDGPVNQQVGNVNINLAKASDLVFKGKNFGDDFRGGGIRVSESELHNPVLYRCKTDTRERTGITVADSYLGNGTFVRSDIRLDIDDKSIMEHSAFLGGSVKGTGLENLAKRTGISIGVEWEDSTFASKLDKRFWITSTTELNAKLSEIAAQGFVSGPNVKAVATAATFILQDKVLQAELAGKGVDVSPATLQAMQTNLSEVYKTFDYLKDNVDALVADTIDKPDMNQAPAYVAAFSKP